jgi:hypothetical protein
VARPVLIHYHIFKNAGTSVDWLLRKSFGDNWTTFEGQHAADVQSADRVRTFLEGRPDIVALSSHLGRPPLPWPAARAIVFLRQPLERARSVHAFVARDATQPNHAVARRGFANYVRWALDSNDGGVVIRNYQVIHLSTASLRAGHIYRAEATADDLGEAVRYLDAWNGVGVVSRFDDSCRVIQQALVSTFPALNLASIRLNVTHAARPEETERLEEIREELGAETYARLLAANELDLSLYAHAQRLLHRRLALVTENATH